MMGMIGRAALAGWMAMLVGATAGRPVPAQPPASQPDRSRRVTIDAAGRTCIDGEPFFTIGLYAVSPGELALARELGFNTVHTYAGEGGKDRDSAAPAQAMRDYLDAAEAAGLKVFMGLPRFQVVKGQEDKLSERIKLLRDSPALLAWRLFDEPYHQKVPAAPVAASAELIRSLDPNHPTVLVLCLVYQRQKQHRKDPAYFNCADILMTDPYPVRAAKSDLSQVSRELAVTSELLAGRKPLWNVVQLHGRGPGGPGYGLFEPTWPQLRNMVFQSLVAGARGVTFFACGGSQFKLAKSEQGQANAKRITAELRALAPVLLADPPRTAPPFTVAPNEALRTRWFRRDGDWRLLAVNLQYKPTKIDLAANPPELLAGDVQVLFEDRTIKTSRGRMSDPIEPIGVRVYRIPSAER